MRHLLGPVLLAVAVEAALKRPGAHGTGVVERLQILAVYLAAALAHGAAARWLPGPVGVEPLGAQLYVCAVLALIGAARAAGALGPWRPEGRESRSLGRALGILCLLGIPVVTQAPRVPLSQLWPGAAVAGVTWLSGACVIDTLADELRAGGAPASMQGPGGRLVLSGLLYWAMMGFMNVGPF